MNEINLLRGHNTQVKVAKFTEFIELRLTFHTLGAYLAHDTTFLWVALHPQFPHSAVKMRLAKYAANSNNSHSNIHQRSIILAWLKLIAI